MLYLALVLAQYVDVGPAGAGAGGSRRSWSCRRCGFAQYTVAINLFGFFAVALLAGSLAERLRSAGARLEDASHEIADLRAFNEYVIDSLLSGLVTTDADCRDPDVQPRGVRRSPAFRARRRSGTTRRGAAAAGRIRGAAGRRSARRAALRIDTQHRTGDGRSIDLGLTVDDR